MPSSLLWQWEHMGSSAVVIESWWDIIGLSESSSRDGVGEYNRKKGSKRKVHGEGLSDPSLIGSDTTVIFNLNKSIY